MSLDQYDIIVCCDGTAVIHCPTVEVRWEQLPEATYREQLIPFAEVQCEEYNYE
jgi:hypothetical protein